MNKGTSPMMLRRRLRTELRTARLKNSLTQEQVAKANEWSLSKINRIEQAKSRISANDLKALLQLYGITDKEQADELLALARAARQAPWWRRYSDVAPATLLELIDYESVASSVKQYETTFVPGILQTEEYASAVLQIFYDETTSAERVAALVDLRTKRRELLNSEDAPSFSFVLDESITHRLVGSPSITSQQLAHLANVAELPNVTIQILPFTASLHPGIKGTFKVVEFADTPDENIVFLEGPRGDLIIDNPEETERYLEDFRRIMEKGLSPSDSVSRLREAARMTA
jgi:transcriptional regulator with XRE-family HTH domain